MGDPRNWTERKAMAVQAQNAASDRDQLRQVMLFNHSAADLEGKLGPNFLTLNPCDTFRVFRFSVQAECAGCGLAWEVQSYGLLNDSPWAHRHWPAVMAYAVICPRCTSCPCELRFRAPEGGEVGAISVRSQLTLHVMGPSRVNVPLVSRGMPDPDAQHDDGEL